MRSVASAVKLLAVSSVIAAMAACGGGGDGATAPVAPSPVSVATVIVTLPASQISVGATTTAVAELRSSSNAVIAGRAVTWSSSAPAIASVDQAGVVTAAGVGVATITASSEGKSGTALVTVIPAPVATVVMTIAQPSLTLGGATTASVVLRDERGVALTDRAIAWTSSAPNVAAVSSSGAITTLSVGTTTISASSEGKSASATLTVLPVPIATITIAGPSTLAPGVSAGFTATPRDAAGAALTNRLVTWTSSDVNVAQVSAGGTVTATAPGTTTISAASEGRTGSLVLTVRYNIATVTLTGASRVKVGDAYTYSATAKLSDGTIVNRPVQWSIAEAGRATVTSSGQVTPLQVGTFTLVVTIDGEPWTSTYTSYDWDTFVSGGSSFVTLDADILVVNQVGTSDRPRLIVSCATEGYFFLWLRTPHIITQSGTIAYSFDGRSPVSATWRELSPDFRTLWHPGTNASTKLFTSQIAASRQFGFAFSEFLGSAKATIFRVTGMTPLVAPLYTLCPGSAIVAGAPSDGTGSAQRLTAEANAMAAYLAVRGESPMPPANRDAGAHSDAQPSATDQSALLTAWPVWSATATETRQAKRVR